MGTWHRLRAVSEERGGAWVKDGEGVSQRTYMHDPWTQTTAWGWPEGRGAAGAGCGRQRGENGDIGDNQRQQ